tara:strand:+ start:4026 stop:4568 length:543 start_codon:yes stop_codon:yes gene_type:complete
MDKQKARLILQLDKYTDVHEAYEDLLFGLKTLILNQGIIPKVLRKRQERLNSIHDAYLCLENIKPKQYEKNEINVTGDNWETLFLNYEKNKSKFKRDIALSTDAIAIVNAIDGLILNQQLWSDNFKFDYNTMTLPTLGKEMDSMELLDLLKSYKDLEFERLPEQVRKEFGRVLKNLEFEK